MTDIPTGTPMTETEVLARPAYQQRPIEERAAELVDALMHELRLQGLGRPIDDLPDQVKESIDRRLFWLAASALNGEKLAPNDAQTLTPVSTAATFQVQPGGSLLLSGQAKREP